MRVRGLSIFHYSRPFFIASQLANIISTCCNANSLETIYLTLHVYLMLLYYVSAFVHYGHCYGNTLTYRDALMVVTDIKQCLNELEEEMVAVPVELVDPSVAMIYAKSKRGKVSVRMCDGECCIRIRMCRA